MTPPQPFAMKSAKAILGGLLVAILVFIAGYLVGALIYAVAGDQSFSAPGTILANYQGLAGGVFTLIAAFVAYSAVKQQIEADDARHAKTRRDDARGIAMAISSTLAIAAVELRERPGRALSAFIEDALKSWIVDASRMHSGLGQALIACVHEADLFRESRQNHVALDLVVSRSFGARCAILGVGFRALADALLLEDAPPDRLVADEDLARIRDRFGIDPKNEKSALNWASIVAPDWPV